MFLLNFQYCAILTLYWTAYCCILGFPMLLFTDKGFSYTQIGVILACVQLSSALIQPYFQSLLYHFRFMTLKRLNIILFSISALIIALLPLLPASYPVYFCIFIVIAITMVAGNSLLYSFGMEYINAGIRLNFGLTRGISSLGWALIGLILGSMLDQYDVIIMPLSSAFFHVLLVLAIIWIPPANQCDSVLKTEKLPEVPADEKIPSPSARVFLHRTPKFFHFLIGAAILNIGVCLMSSSFVPNYLSRYGGNSSDVGVILAVSAACEFPVMAYSAKLSRRFHMNVLMIFAITCYVLQALGTWLAPSFNFYLAVQFLHGFNYGLYHIVSIFYANRIVHSADRVLGQGLLIAVNAIGNFFANTLSGILIDNTGVNGLAMACVVSTTAGALILIRLMWKDDPQTD